LIFLICYLTYHTYLGVVLHRGPTRFLEPQWVPPDLPGDSAHAHRAGHRHCAADFGDTVPRVAGNALTRHKKNRPLDVAVVDVMSP